MKYKYLPMVVSNLDFNWLCSKVCSRNKDYVYLDPKGNWSLNYSELAVWKEFANHRSKLLPKDIGLGQDDIYSEILHNIEKFNGKVE